MYDLWLPRNVSKHYYQLYFSTDVNDNAPEFVRKLHETSVAENVAVGTEVLRVMATSRDIGVNADISYSLQHTTLEEYLHIHPKTGKVVVNIQFKDFCRFQITPIYRYFPTYDHIWFQLTSSNST